MTIQADPNPRWWGSFKISPEETGHWRIGPMSLWVQRLAGEWRIAHVQAEDPLEPTLENRIIPEAVDMTDLGALTRFALTGGDQQVHLSPVLADRPVVTRPEVPFTILPGEKTILHVSSPLWVRIEVGKKPQLLAELPLYRPSDTWFGASTVSGELCYASRSFGRLRIEQVPFRPHRAVTAVEIANRVGTPILIQRFKLPVGLLSLFQDEQGRLWTEDIFLRRVEGEDYAELQIQEKRWRKARAGTQLVSKPRNTLPVNLVARTFGSLFGEG